jgi:hypothetical protein
MGAGPVKPEPAPDDAGNSKLRQRTPDPRTAI